VGDSNTTYYACTDGTDYEVGIGTFTLSGTTLARTTIIESSNSDLAVSWGAGSKDIFVTSPADKTLLVGRNLYADNPSSATMPSATGTNAVAIGSGATATADNSFSFGIGAASGIKSITIGEGTNSGAQAVYIGWAGSTVSASQAIGIGRAITATGTGSLAIGGAASATSSYASAIGRNSTNAGSVAATGSGAMALGGSYASGTDSFAAAIANNTSSYGASGNNSIAMGYLAKASGNQSTAIGDTAQATGLNSICIGDAVASGRSTIVIDGEGSSTHSGLRGVTIGYSSTGSADYSAVIGTNANDQGIISRFAFSGSTFNNDGDSQQGMFPLRLATTDATPAALTTNGGAASTDNQVILPNNSAYAFHGTIVARQQAAGGTACAAWKIEGLIRREANAGTTTLVNSATTVLDNTPSWGMALSADTTNGGLKIEVTGAASTNIRWVATINTSEVTYA
jgi:hypothetical protein